MPDFSCIDWFGGDFTPEQSIALHRASRDWLAEQLARPHDGPTLVVSHHAPSAVDPPSSSATRCRQPSLPTSTNWWRRPTTGCTVTSTMPRLPHRPGTVLANPGGYPHERGGFRPEFVFEVEPQRGNWLKKRQISLARPVPGRSCRESAGSDSPAAPARGRRHAR